MQKTSEYENGFAVDANRFHAISFCLFLSRIPDCYLSNINTGMTRRVKVAAVHLICDRCVDTHKYVNMNKQTYTL